MNKESELTFELVSAFLEGIDRRDFLSTQDCKRINAEELRRGELAFNAYVEAVDGIAYNGNKINPWDHPNVNQAGWIAVANAIVTDICRDLGSGEHI